MAKKTKSNQDWYTPPHIIDFAYNVLGEIDLDPASCEEANKIVRAKQFYTKEQDGLSLSWACNTMWLNPTFWDMTPWTDKLVLSVGNGDTKAALLLTNNCTETGWWQFALDHSAQVLFLRGRVPFWGPLDKGNSPRQGQTIFLFRQPGHFYLDVAFRRVGTALGAVRPGGKE